MIPLPLTLLLIVLTGIVTFSIGWDISVRRFNAARRRDRARIRQLESDLVTLSADLQNDPARAGIDTGKQYAITRMQGVIDDIRSEL